MNKKPTTTTKKNPRAMRQSKKYKKKIPKNTKPNPKTQT